MALTQFVASVLWTEYACTELKFCCCHESVTLRQIENHCEEQTRTFALSFVRTTNNSIDPKSMTQKIASIDRRVFFSHRNHFDIGGSLGHEFRMAYCFGVIEKKKTRVIMVNEKNENYSCLKEAVHPKNDETGLKMINGANFKGFISSICFSETYWSSGWIQNW